MFNLFIKSISIIGSCGGLAILSTQWSKPETREYLEKINLDKKEKTIKKIERIEDIDVWGKENGCSFIFVKNFNNRKIYTSLEYVKNNDRNLVNERKKIEKAMINAANTYKSYCGEKMKTFTFLWSDMEDKFYIGDPKNHSKAEHNALMRQLDRNWVNGTIVIR